jgi:hypothetical protein
MLIMSVLPWQMLVTLMMIVSILIKSVTMLLLMMAI